MLDRLRYYVPYAWHFVAADRQLAFGLYLDASERAGSIDRLFECKSAGLPLINSRAGLMALRSGDWPRRMPTALTIDSQGESQCCRASDDVCPDCGYGACTELSEAQRLRTSAVLGMVRYV